MNDNNMYVKRYESGAVQNNAIPDKLIKSFCIIGTEFAFVIVHQNFHCYMEQKKVVVVLGGQNSFKCNNGDV